MPMPSDPEDAANRLRAKIIGLGEKSTHKSYYPELQSRLTELERFRALVDHSPDCVFLIEVPYGEIVDVTLSASTLLKRSAQSLIGAKFVSLLDEKPEVERGMYYAVFGENKSEQPRFNTYLLAADGQRIPVEVIFSQVWVDSKLYAVVVAREISERLRTEKIIQSQLQHLTALHAIDVAITSMMDVSHILDSILEQITGSLYVDAAVVWVCEKGHAAYCGTARGFRKPLDTVTPSNTSCENDGQVVFIRRLDHSPRQEAMQSILDGEEFISYASIPLISKGLPHGLLEIYHRGELNPDAEWYGYLENLAAQVSVALDNHRLFRDLQKKNQELNQAYDAPLEGWAAALELRERETGMHTRRVRDLPIRVASTYGFSEADLVQIQRGALLHDIGKMGIPDQILLKPGKLNDEEWQVMRLHPQYAYEWLSCIPFLADAINIPYCHHEHWDGSGYPRGLKGEDIPLEARIFTVVDVWDALLSNRPYRQAWPRERVLEHLQEQSGRLFDPRVLKRFLEIVP